MSKRLIIVLGIGTILIALGVWGYLLIFGTPETTDTFNDLDVSQPDRPTPPPPGNPNGTQTLDIRTGLQQLTTRSVAGFIYLEDTDIVRYVERGTGHIYDISLEDNSERRVSNTTIPRVDQAIFSPSGERVALQSTANGARSTLLATISEEQSNINGVDLPQNIQDPFFNRADDFFYVLTSIEQSVGYRYDPESQETTGLFTIPLTSFRTLWAYGTSSNHFVITKADSRVPGYMYEVTNNQLSPTVVSGMGIVANRNGETFYVSSHIDGVPKSYRYEHESGSLEELVISTLPEKCSDGQTVYCAGQLIINLQDIPYRLPEMWYKGTIIQPDWLWEFTDAVNPLTGEQSGISLLSDMSEESGRTIDATDVTGAQDLVLFRNRIDNSLWAYIK